MDLCVDTHVHTRFSVDAADDMSKMCQAAIDKGLKHICFTDHVEFNPLDEGYRHFDYDAYMDAIARNRDRFSDKIDILAGIEFSEPQEYPREFEKLLKKDLDSVMIGIHYAGEKGEFGLHWADEAVRRRYADTLCSQADEAILRKYTKEKIFRSYYEDLLRAVKLGGFDVLAHFDNPKRYLKESGDEQELMAEIIRILAKSGIAMEINTSPLRRGLPESAPDSDILEQFIASGGSRVTIGSDAHRSSDIGANFDYGIKLVKKYGATRGYFRKRHFVAVK